MLTPFNLSIIIITRNEEHDIDQCLASVKDIASEIILVDSGSTDRTLEIARLYTDRIFQKKWEGYSRQKQYALDLAQGPWVLNIDADERVTPALREEILETLKKKDSALFGGYFIPFHHYFMGRRLRFGGLANETHLRLFKKQGASYGAESVHEGIRAQGTIGKLKGAIDHQSYRDLREYLEKCNEYTSAIAKKKWEAGERFHWWHHLRLPLEFVVRYGLKMGFLDGQAGLTYALLSSYYVWLKFLKLRELQEKI
ncbi:MAG: hypothetical protein KCHDKBKB_00150 [Elusimicrobia bacterium]|nr:hypothetical protein [Elusimicrobiota bacterium]